MRRICNRCSFRIDPPQENVLNNSSDETYSYRGQKEGYPEASRRSSERLGKAESHISPQHVERSVGEVYDPHDSEYEREPRGHEKKHHGSAEAAHKLAEKKGQVKFHFTMGPCPSSGQLDELAKEEGHRRSSYFATFLESNIS